MINNSTAIFYWAFRYFKGPFFDFQNRSTNWTPCECYFL